jgi:hypothetical protein
MIFSFEVANPYIPGLTQEEERYLLGFCSLARWESVGYIYPVKILKRGKG